VIIGHYDDLR
jgi:hypothetical protein